MIWPGLMQAFWRGEGKAGPYRTVGMVAESCLADHDDEDNDDLDTISMCEFERQADAKCPLLGQYAELRAGEYSYDSNGVRSSFADTISDSTVPPISPGLLSTNSGWSELDKIGSRRSSDAGLSDFSRTSHLTSNTSRSISNVSSSLSEHLRYLVRAFSSRTEQVKESTLQPPSPSSVSDYNGSDVLSAISTEQPTRRRLDSFFPDPPDSGSMSEGEGEEEEVEKVRSKKFKWPRWLRKLRFPHVIEPQSKLYLIWLFIVTVAFMYNAGVIPLRGVFPYQTDDNLHYWLICDYVCDFVYIVDIFLFKMRITFLNSGLKETHRTSTKKNYMKKRMFKFDCLSLLPLDLFYLVNMEVNPWWRLPRLLKIQTFWEFYSRCDHLLRSAHAMRIIKTMTYMLFLIHLETCGYYAVSVYEGIGTNQWVYTGKGNAYIRCFYLATKTATSIGNNPKPTNTLEYMFMTVYWVSGVFVFALLIGQIRDIVDAANLVKTVYTQRMDNALNYVKNMNLPADTQQRVRTWFVYNWQQTKIIDETSLMDTLPMKLRKDLAIHVHFNTLSKVKLFQDCDKTLLYDLVLKLKPVLYLPGDYVCKKGEIGKEMYIVSQGIVEVVGGPSNSLVLATLKEGSVFGEISLLAMATEGGNRRTADVRCKGFTNLFILSKADFEAAMKDYPDAHNLLKKRAKKLLRVNARLERQSQTSIDRTKIRACNIIRTPPETPRMVKTVIQIMDPDSSVLKHLQGSIAGQTEDQDEAQTVSDNNVSTSKNNNNNNNNNNEEDGTDNRGYEAGSEVHQKYNLKSKSLPSNQEAEAFYDEMLTTRVWSDMKHDPEPDDEPTDSGTNQPGSGSSSGPKKNSNSSTSSNDSGVQDTKTTSPTCSTPRSISNKDSKESFMSTELGDILEDPEDPDEQPTIDGINYTAEMFGDIESQTNLDNGMSTETIAPDTEHLSRAEKDVTLRSKFEDNEYAFSLASGFKILVDSATDYEMSSGTASPLTLNSESKKDVLEDIGKCKTVIPNSDIRVVSEGPDFSEDKEKLNGSCKAIRKKGSVDKLQLVKKADEQVKKSINSRNKLGLKISVEKASIPEVSPYMKFSAASAKALKQTNSKQSNMMRNRKTSKEPTGRRTMTSLGNQTRDVNNKPDRNKDKSLTRNIKVLEARTGDSVDSVKNEPVSIPSENQVTCFAEVHREKTLSPKLTVSEQPAVGLEDSPIGRQRKISVISIGTILKDGRETLV